MADMLHANPAPPFGFFDFPAGPRGNDYIAGMVKLVLMAAMLSGCATYFGDDGGEVDAGAADTTECEPTLPRCFDLGCAVGGLAADCPRGDEVCYCDAPQSASWCFNR